MKKPILETLSGNPIEKQLVFNILPLKNGAKGVLDHIEKTINVSKVPEEKTVFNVEINYECPPRVDCIVAAYLMLYDDVKSLTWCGTKIFPREEF
ncbi:MAG: hypothetical protein PHY21_09850 [Candidatus Cloacimonetes bacterium]|jgi:hypothetical protein|nr:hypothetical protein [Candidatus Cloacimonadota bacterium]